jgi:hypothetical protein
MLKACRMNAGVTAWFFDCSSCPKRLMNFGSDKEDGGAALVAMWWCRLTCMLDAEVEVAAADFPAVTTFCAAAMLGSL